MCVQGSAPSFLISVWDWKKKELIARSEGEPFPIYKLLFSQYDSSFITTSGYCHINFWRIVGSSSGVKMDKVAGKFSRKPISDIEAFVQLSDGKVVSGSTWGSLLLWFNGQVEVEIKRRDMSPCHQGSVLQFVIAEGELISTGADGWIRVWDLESIQQAEGMNLEKEDGLFLLDPINEIQVAPDAVLQSISKSKMLSKDEENFWYVQDAGGGIWKVDLSFSLTMKKPEKIFQCHAGAVTCLVTSPSENVLISGGMDGRICAYNLKRKLMVNSVKYNCGITCMYWFPIDMDSTGTQVLIGFADGVLRHYYIMSSTSDGNLRNVMKSLTVNMKLLQALKPHRKSITKLTSSQKHHVCASSSLDNTVFVYRLNTVNLLLKIVPIGYFGFSKMIVAINFHPTSETPLLMIGMEDGTLSFLDLNKLSQRPEEHVGLDLSVYKQSEVDLKQVFSQQEDLKLINVWYEENGLIQCSVKIGDEIYICVINKDTEIEPLFVLDTVRIEKPTQSSELSTVKPPIRSIIFCGFSDGFLKLSDIKRLDGNHQWMQAISDSINGKISDILVMEDYLVTSGMDGTLFVFALKPEIFKDQMRNVSSSDKPWENYFRKRSVRAKLLDSSCFENIHDIEDPNHLCIEDMNTKTKEEQTNKEMEEKMMKIQKDVSNLKRDFKKLLLKNEILPREFKVPKESFRMTDYTFNEIQEGINKDLENMKKSFQPETDKALMLLNNLKARYFDPIKYNRICVKGLQSKQELSTFRLVSLNPNNFYSEEFEEIVVSNNQQETYTPKTPKLADGITRSTFADTTDTADSTLSTTTTNFSRTKVEVKLTNDRVLKALSKQEEKREKKLQRNREWDELYSRKPRDTDEDPTLIEEIKQARENIGDFKRKTSNEFRNKRDRKPDEIAKQINFILRTIYQEKKTFNMKVLALRNRKKEVIEELENIYKEIIDIQDNLDPFERVNIHPIPTFDSEELDVDNFSIEQKDVEKMKMKLVQNEEESELSKRGMGSRRSSKASLIGRKFSKQLSSSSRQSSLSGQLGLVKAKHAESMFANLQAHGHSTLEEDETDLTEECTPRKSHIEEMMEGINTILSKHQQTKKIAKMNQIMSQYDDEIFEAVCEKDVIESRLKYAELSLIFLFEEYQIINQDLELEAELKADVEKQTASLEKINAKLEGVEKQLKCKQKNVETYKEQKRSIDENVERELSDNKHSDFLWSLYNRKPPALLTEDCYADIALEMGVPKTFTAGIQPGDSVCEDDEINTKPEDLDMETFKLIRDFRNKKHDAEAGLSVERRLEDNIGRELANLKTISASKEKILKESQNDLHTFMLNKQKKLNELDQLIIINIDSLRYLDHDRLTSSRPSCDELLSFPEDTLSALQQRTEELKYEKNSMKKKYKETKNIYEGLINHSKVLKREIQALDQKCNIEMEKRFGTGITLESLEAFAVNRTLEEMKESLQAKEKAQWKMQDNREIDIQNAKIGFHQQVIENTEILTKYTTKQKERFANMEKKKKWQKLISDNLKKQETDEESERELKELVQRFQDQGAEIQELKASLMRYLMKTGMVDKPQRIRPLTARKKQEPLRLREVPPELDLDLHDRPRLQVSQISTRRMIPTIDLQL